MTLGSYLAGGSFEILTRELISLNVCNARSDDEQELSLAILESVTTVLLRSVGLSYVTAVNSEVVGDLLYAVFFGPAPYSSPLIEAVLKVERKHPLIASS